jgi:hypothetical protein
MTTSKTFPLAAVLSVTTGKLLCDIGQVYEILNFMTGDNLFTHQLPRASRECAPYLCELFPVLAEVDAEEVNGDNWKSWLAQQSAQHGEYLEVLSLPDHAHKFVDPFSELSETIRPKLVLIKTTEKSA